MAYRERVKAVQ